MARYDAGETLASIARTYDCSPPAISYIVSRSRARSAAIETLAPDAPPPAEPQLVKSYVDRPAGEISPGEEAPGDMSDGDAPQPLGRLDGGQQRIEPRTFPDEVERVLDLREDPPQRTGNGPADRYEPGGRDDNPVGNANPSRSFGSAGVPSQGGEPRRTLHLPLSHGDTHPNGGPDPQPRNPRGAETGERFAPPRPAGGQQGFGHSSRQDSVPAAPTGNGAPMRILTEPQRSKDGGAFIDQALRERVDGDIAAFLAAFDAALSNDTPESRAGLREATDRLLRAGARTRIELERLEARGPLPPRDAGGQAAPAWRHR
jgi:hypothetical protein